HDFKGVATVNRHVSGEQLIHDAAKRVDVRSLIDRVAFAQLRTHVSRGAKCRASHRQFAACESGLLCDFRQPKVHYFYDWRAGIEICNVNVGWLDVSMNNLLCMGGA